MGATDPAKASEGTLRKAFGSSIGGNATHGSDAPETAAYEIGYFFRGMELDLTGLGDGRRKAKLLVVIGLAIARWAWR